MIFISHPDVVQTKWTNKTILKLHLPKEQSSGPSFIISLFKLSSILSYELDV